LGTNLEESTLVELNNNQATINFKSENFSYKHVTDNDNKKKLKNYLPYEWI